MSKTYELSKELKTHEVGKIDERMRSTERAGSAASYD
jgi:hypothetical protein